MPVSLRAPFALLLLLALAVAAAVTWGPAATPSLLDRAQKAAPGPDARPSDWAMAQRLYPHSADDLDAAALARVRAASREAISQSVAMRGAARGGPFGAWQQDGPTDIGGRISDIEFAPSDPNRVYAGVGTGGVFRSDDGGLTWTPIFDEQALLNIGDLAVHPTDPDVLWVGTGEANGNAYNFAGGGIYRTDDGGLTWTPLGLEATYSIGRIRIDPTDPSRVFVAALGAYFGKNEERGVFRTTDDGASWERLLFLSDSTAVVDLAMKPDDPNTLLAATWSRIRRLDGSNLSGSTSGLWRSTDGGDSWEELTNGLPNPDAQPVGRIGLDFSESQPNTAYALYTDGYYRIGLWRSDDAGTAWRRYDRLFNELPEGAGFQWYLGQIRVRPNNPDHVFVLGVPLLRPIGNGGPGWVEEYGDYLETLHVDHHAMAFQPGSPDYVLSGNDGGIDLSTDGGASWTAIDGLPITQFYEIGLDAQNPERRYGGTQDNNTIRTIFGEINDWERILGGDGFYVIVDPTDPETIYAESQFGNLGKSTDGGSSFLYVAPPISWNEPVNWSTPVVMDPDDPQTLYYGSNRVWRTTNGAASWEPVSPVLTREETNSWSHTLTTLAVHPLDPDVVWAGTADGKVWVTTDGAATWTDATRENLPNRWVTRLAPDPTDPMVAYVSYSGLRSYDPIPRVLRTDDGGLTWTDLSAGLPDAPANALAVDPVDPSVVYLGLDTGPFVSTDRGETWEVLGTGMPAVAVFDLKVHPTERTLVAGTHGRSMFSLDVSGVTVASEPGAAAEALTLAPAFPNPTAGAATLRYTLAAPGPVALDVFDVLGRRVATLVDGDRPAGEHTARFDGSGLASGRYVVHLRADGQERTQPLTLTR